MVGLIRRPGMEQDIGRIASVSLPFPSKIILRRLYILDVSLVKPITGQHSDLSENLESSAGS